MCNGALTALVLYFAPVLLLHDITGWGAKPGNEPVVDEPLPAAHEPLLRGCHAVRPESCVPAIWLAKLRNAHHTWHTTTLPVHASVLTQPY